MKQLLTSAICLAAVTFMSACGNSSSKTPASVPQYKSELTFSQDSAYQYVRDQVKFGPRVPGTKAHTDCANYILDKFRQFGADTIITQNALVAAHTGDELPITNIMAQYRPELNDRVLIVAHYDTRPWADQDKDEANTGKPIDGANDGASGVAVMLEMARNLAIKNPHIGVDFLAVDAEDYGKSDGWGNSDETWCLGTQYWVNHTPYTADNRPRYAIVLDMVGGKGARFHREFHSHKFAPKVVDKVWGMAAASPYAVKFVNEIGGALIDDHLFLNNAGIPAIDIVECNNAETRGFPPTWHTVNDNLQHIDPASLKAAGQVVLDVIYSETPSSPSK